MKLRHRRRELHGVVGAIGVTAGLAGFLTDIYAPTTAVVLMFAIFAVGATLVNVFTEPGGE